MESFIEENIIIGSTLFRESQRGEGDGRAGRQHGQGEVQGPVKRDPNIDPGKRYMQGQLQN